MDSTLGIGEIGVEGGGWDVGEDSGVETETVSVIAQGCV